MALLMYNILYYIIKCVCMFIIYSIYIYHNTDFIKLFQRIFISLYNIKQTFYKQLFILIIYKYFIHFNTFFNILNELCLIFFKFLQ